MLDFPLMLYVKIPVVEIIHPQSNKFVTGVENKAIGDSKLKDSLACAIRWKMMTMTTSQHGGHTPADRSKKARSFSLQQTYLIILLDIHVIVY